jgi:hypothetical protein
MSTEELIERWNSTPSEVKEILGRPNFACGHSARILQKAGFEILNRSEDKQALVIFVMMEFHKEYGDQCFKEFVKLLEKVAST